MAKNVHNVQKQKWAKWGKAGQATFNRLWSRIHRELVMPNGKELEKDDLRIMRWNVCWEAADLAPEILNDFVTSREWRAYVRRQLKEQCS